MKDALNEKVDCYFCGDKLQLKPGPKAPAWGQCPTCKARVFATKASVQLLVAARDKEKMKAKTRSKAKASVDSEEDISAEPWDTDDVITETE
jgi:acetyl-CoA carboxylase beta subunit